MREIIQWLPEGPPLGQKEPDMPRGKGRPANVVYGRDGKPIHGMSQDKSTGRYYVTGSKPKVYLGKDLDLAVMRFSAFLEGKDPKVRIVQKRPILNRWVYPPKPIGEVDQAIEIDSPAFWSELRRLLLEEPAKVAEKTGIPEVARLAGLPKPENPIPLDTLLAPYLASRKQTRQYEREASVYWSEFLRVIKHKAVSDIEPNDLVSYSDTIKHNASSPAYIRNRFAVVRAVIRFHASRNLSQQLSKLVSILGILEVPKQSPPKPTPISRSHFHQLYEKADYQQKALLLVMLNCMYRSTDCCELKVSDIDLERGTIVNQRKKTGQTRASVLWPETIKRLTDVIECRERESEYVFVGLKGPYTPSGLVKVFNAVRDKAGLKGKVKSEDLRDGAYNAAVSSKGIDVDKAKIIAGHSCGVPSRYIQANPTMVQQASEAIYQHYFG